MMLSRWLESLKISPRIVLRKAFSYLFALPTHTSEGLRIILVASYRTRNTNISRK